MNEQHLQLCASDEWADALRQWIVPGALAGVELGDDVLEVGPGPGRSTDLLREMTPRLTAVEADAALARDLHAGDVCNPIEPDSLDARLRAAGFRRAQVEVNPYVIEFRARV